jgi:mRNA interferase MazF
MESARLAMSARSFRRGDLVTVSLSGDFGKPRPALIIQSDAFSSLPSVTVLSLTSDLYDAKNIRVTIRPNEVNGLQLPSQIMIDRAATLRRDKIGKHIGRIEAETLDDVYDKLIRFLGR